MGKAWWEMAAEGKKNTDFFQYYNCFPVHGYEWLVCKAHQREGKSVTAVLTSLKLNTYKILKESRFCLRIFSLTKIQWKFSWYFFFFLFAYDKNLGVLNFFCCSGHDFKNWPFILIGKNFWCAFKVMVKKWWIPVLYRYRFLLLSYWCQIIWWLVLLQDKKP